MGGDCLVAVPALVCLAAAVRVRHRHPQRYRSPLDPSRTRAVPRLHRLSGLQIVAARLHPDHRLGAGGRRRLRRRLPVPVLSRARAAPGHADDDRPRRGRAPASCCCSKRRAARSACRWCSSRPSSFCSRLPGRTCRKPCSTKARRFRASWSTNGSSPKACSASRSACRPASCSCSCCSARCSTRPAAATG